MLDNFFNASSLLIIGHRGAAGLASENTLPSFHRALALGCPALELDVHCVFDASGAAQLVIIHDERLDRTTDASGLVSDCSFEQLAMIDAGGGARIPSLTQVLDLVAAQSHPVLTNIELKGENTAAATARLIDERKPKCLVSSFNHDELRVFRNQDKTTPVALLYSKWQADWLDTAQALNAETVNLAKKIVNETRVNEIHAAGYRCLVYTVNRASEARSLAEMGVDGIFTDRPDRMTEWLPSEVG